MGNSENGKRKIKNPPRFPGRVLDSRRSEPAAKVGNTEGRVKNAKIETFAFAWLSSTGAPDSASLTFAGADII